MAHGGADTPMARGFPVRGGQWGASGGAVGGQWGGLSGCPAAAHTGAMDLNAALAWQIALGADEALLDTPQNRLRAERRSAIGARAEPPRQEWSPESPPESPQESPQNSAPVAAAPEIPRATAPGRAGGAMAGLPATPVQQAESLAAAAPTIAALRDALAGFEGCALRATAGNLVFADGNPDAGLVFIGEAPGAEEDETGRPFVGPSGQLLDRMLASIGLDRRHYLITNIIPWRPPGNRNPTDAEILVCLPFLRRHLALLRPKRLVLLGKTAASAMTGRNEGIRRMRGRWLEVSVPGLPAPIPALPTLHPAYLLRTHAARRDVWADLITLRRALDADAAAGP